MYNFLKFFKKKSKKLKESQIKEIVEFARLKQQEKKIEEELLFILDKFPEIYELILQLYDRIIDLENNRITYL